MNELFPITETVEEANRRFDNEHGNPHLLAKIRPSWNESRMLLRKKLTDKQIAKYEKEGFYSAEFKSARREAWERKAAKKRSGNFDVEPDGRMIYRPR